MNSLDRLIERIKQHATVSNEDAVDSTKQYWEEAADTVKEYWEPVDAPLAEELGVTPVALAELLDDNRHAFVYANIGGNSGVAGYDHGDDWIVVKFTTGSRYLYTLKSTTPESLGYLKKYAKEGKGLNSYIMRMLREDYAGKNVKGEILIKPGMEHYSHGAIKRITLLEDFRRTLSDHSHRKPTMKDKTLNTYKTQLEQAGTDGLDPVARQFMTVGLEQLGTGVTVSTEDSNETDRIPSTEALLETVEKAIEAV